jgi:hypothetical protein
MQGGNPHVAPLPSGKNYAQMVQVCRTDTRKRTLRARDAAT